jgi:predicted nucleic-acid-binding protein
MTGLDTNVLVRYIMQDDAKQSPKATLLIESLSVDEPGFVTTVTVVELAWVLSSAYALTRQQLTQAFAVLLGSKQLVVERADQVIKAVRVFSSSSADFADCLIERAAASAGCSKTMTFDVGAAKTAGLVLVR